MSPTQTLKKKTRSCWCYHQQVFAVFAKCKTHKIYLVAGDNTQQQQDCFFLRKIISHKEEV